MPGNNKGGVQAREGTRLAVRLPHEMPTWKERMKLLGSEADARKNRTMFVSTDQSAS
jgi:hypothetical protein